MKKPAAIYDSFFNNHPVPSLFYELETFKIVDANFSAIAIYGYSKEEFLSCTLKDLVVKESKFELEEAHKDAFSETKSICFGVFKVKTKTGEVVFTKIDGYKSIVKNQHCIAAVFQDVTAEMNGQSDVSKLLNSSLDVFCTVDENGNFDYVSAGSKYHWGYSPEELVGKPYIDLILEDDVPKSLEAATTILEGVDVKSFVNRYKKKNGEVAYNLWSARWDNSSKLLYCVARDGKELVEQERKTRLSEERFKNLVQEASDLIRILDSDGNFIYVSPSSTSLLGITPEEFIGKNALEFLHSEDAERVAGNLLQIKNTKRLLLKPYRVFNSKKEWRWLETVLTNMINDPAVNGIVANSRDITESINSRKLAEEIEQFNATILESSPDCFKVLDAEGRIQFMNFNGLCQMEIDDFSVLKDKNWWDLWGTDNENLVRGAVERALQGENAQFTAFCPTAKGTPKWWDVMVSPVGKPGQQVKQIISVSRDITLQKQEVQRLKLLESVITNTTDAVLITEAEPLDGPGPRILFVNEAFTKMTGYTAEEVIGKTPRILQGPNSNKKDLAKLGKALRNWESCEITTINYKKSGEEFWVNFTVSPVANAEGWYTHWIAVERDVTEQKNKELELKLFSQISNDFRSEIDLVSAISEFCKSVGKFGNFDFVEVWTSNLEKSQMQLFGHHLAVIGDESFYHGNSVSSHMLKKQGLVGRVWSEKTEILWDDVSNHNDFIRKDAAKSIGLKAVLGLPLIFNDEVVGVLLVGVKREAIVLTKYTRIFKKLQGFVGSELNRKKLENDLNHLYAAIPDIICVSDLQGRFLKMNRAGYELLGYTEDEILYRSFQEFVHPDDKNSTQNEVVENGLGKTSSNFENRYITKAGEVIWLSWTTNISMKEGIAYATAKNITEEKKLRELVRMTNSLAKIGSWEVDLISQTIFWSDEVHALHETDPKSFVPNLETAINFYREDFRKIVQLNIDKAVTLGAPFDFEAVLVTANKNEIWVRAIGNAEFVNGDCTRIFGSFQDINSIRETENRIQSLSENLPGVVYQYLVHPDGTDSVRFVSGAVEQLWGFTAEEAMKDMNIVWDRIKLSGDYEKVQSSIMTSIQTKSRWTCRFKHIMPTGELRTHLGNGVPIFLADGTILFNSIILDITREAHNEELLEQTTEMARIGSWDLDLSHEENVYWSPMVKKILEFQDSYNPSFYEGLNFFIGESKQRFSTAIKLLITRGVEFDEELLLLTAKGNELWIRCIGKGTFINKKCVKIYGSFQDIDFRKKANEQLKKAFEEKTTILESIGDAFFALDNDGVVTYWNKKAELILGRKKADLIGKRLWDVYAHARDTEFFIQFLKILETREVAAFEAYSANLDIWLEVSGYPSAEGISVYFKDVTLRKKSDIELIIANERFEKVTQATSDAIWDWDIVEGTQYWGDGFKKLFGYDIDEVKPKLDSWARYVHPIDIKRVSISLDQVLQSKGNSWIEEYRFEKTDGTYATVVDRGIVIRDGSQKAIRMIGAMTDITERKKYEEQLVALNQSLEIHAKDLERSNEELEQFAFVASHDLQEPLRMISSFMDLLLRKYKDQLDEKGHQYIHFAKDGAQRMKQIILDLLEYSRANKLTEGKEVVDMNELLAEFKFLRRKLIAEKKVKIQSVQLPLLFTYKAAINQIFNGIVDNAIKYSKTDVAPVITIGCVENESEWVFSIKDNGIGIDSQFYDKIFVIFQRLHNQDRFTGTGIGLSIAKRHISFIGGTIWLDSTTGEGTVFYFNIPKVS